MPFGTFTDFRNFLTQMSSVGLANQTAFLQKANANAEGIVIQNTTLSDINAAARRLVTTQDAQGGAAEGRIQWLRWTSGETASGVGLVISSATSNYLLLPEKTDPPHLHLEGELPYGRYNLFPNLETLARANGAPLAYIHQDLLRTNFRPEGDVRRFARLLRMVEKGSIPPFPTFRRDPHGTQYWIDERHGGVHWSVLGLQKGMEFVLGEVRSAREPLGHLALVYAAGTYPAYDVVLSEAPDVQDTLPDGTCFGAGDPVYKPLVVGLDETLPIRDAEGGEVGWARLVSGGKNGRHVDPDSGLSAATSLGKRANQEDGYYIARFRTHDGRQVWVVVVADGLGGNEMGEMASSAGLQGVHAGIVHALREKRLPLAGDLFLNAREALEAQILFEEVASGASFPSYTAPDTVISIAVVIDGEATFATAGDAITLLVGRDEKGRLTVLGHTEVDAINANTVTNTLRNGRASLSQARVPKGARLVSLTDGAAGSLSPSYKHHTSTQYRESILGSFAEQSLFSNILRALEAVPPHEAGPALHDAASASPYVEEDNWTAGSLRFEGEYKKPDFDIPGAYGPLESVFPAYQYVFEEGPYALHLPRGFKNLSLGSALHPQRRPMVLWFGDDKLAPVHARLERVDDQGRERFYLEKRTARGRIVIMNEKDNRVASLTRKGSRQEIQKDYLVRLTPRTFFRFR
ncbi:MAG TPA: protein phosphatase 2C domain-containing protein [bacterium]|nr:protein phosphatase 2C domain-containing protein [bacterium]